MNEEIITLVTMTRHQKIVSFILRNIARLLEERADLHDLSKYFPDEFEGFVEINKIAREFPYGSEEYKESIKDNKAIDLHFSRNPHHPEFHKNGINDMSLIDFIEMVCDWKSASMTYGNTDFEAVMSEQIRRFKMTNEQIYLMYFINQLLDTLL